MALRARSKGERQMKINSVTFSWREQRQPQKYESIEAKLEVTVSIEDGEDASKITNAIIARTKDKVKAALAADMKSITAKEPSIL
jgi:hypothetical protein